MHNLDLFIKFSESFVKHQNRWNKAFDYKLKIDELDNTKISDIRKFSNVYSTKSKLRLAIDVLFHDDKLIKDYHMGVDLIIQMHIKWIVIDMLKFMEPYKVGKVLTALKTDPLFYEIYTDQYVIPRLFGKGSADGLYIITGKTDHIEEFKWFYAALMKELKQRDSILYKIFKDDILLLEDFLCEFHMFYRLFENFSMIVPETVIDLINEDKKIHVELSEYVDSDLPYDKFQKQRVISVIGG